MLNNVFNIVSLSPLQVLFDNSSCARQNDVNAHVILPGAHRSAMQAHA